MKHFSKIEIAGVVKDIRVSKMPEYLGLIVRENRTGSPTYNEFAVMFSGSAYEHWKSKIHIGDRLQLLADVITGNCNFDCAQLVVRVRTPDMVIRHEDYQEISSEG